MSESKFPILMQSIAALTTAITLLLLLQFRHTGAGWALTAAISVGTTSYHFLMRLLVGFVVPKMTNYRFDYRNPWFQPRKWETAFYRKLKVRQWKRYLPTYAPSQFSLKSNSLLRVIQNMCGAEVVHEIIMVLSFLPLLLVPVFGEFPVFFLTSLLSALFDSIFVIAQRFNRPRLVHIYEKQEKKRP